jgi:hypothetical protein
MTGAKPEEVKASWLRMLLTVCVPEEWVTVMRPGTSMTTSSSGPGRAGTLLQLAAVFQSPLPPTQVTVAPRS